jgi:hypothetical protein
MGENDGMTRVYDRLWLWGHDAGSHNNLWNLPTESRITPVEAAFYMRIPNVIMVRYRRESMPPTVQYSVPFRALDQVVWSVVGAGGVHLHEDVDRVLELTGSLPNLTGVMMDDFFRRGETVEDVGVLSLMELRRLRERLSAAERPMHLWVVLYDHQLNLPVQEYLELCDKVTFWTWEAQNLTKLEENFAATEKLIPRSCGKVLGCYMWDYGGKTPMPVESMERQCQLGFRWLKEGRIEGMIFLASCICDLDIPAVEWTRGWIAEAGDEQISV